MERKESFRIIVVQLDNVKDLLGIMSLDGVSNARIRELYGVTKRVDESTDKSVLLWFGHIERMGKELN